MVKSEYSKIDFDLAFVHGTLSFRVDDYTPQPVTLFVKIPYHPAIQVL